MSVYPLENFAACCAVSKRMFLPFSVLVSLSADSLETGTLSYLVGGPVNPTEAELGFSLMAGVGSRRTPWIHCRSRYPRCILLLHVVGPQRDIVFSRNAIRAVL